MYSVEPFYPSDVFSLDLVNLDEYTENYSIDYYFYYLLNHSDDCYKIVSCDTLETESLCQRAVFGYLISKHEFDTEFHAHVTALSVAPQYRKFGLGKHLMDLLKINATINEVRFIDLFVKTTNQNAIKFYKSLGYCIFKTIPGYYTFTKEDAYDMHLYIKKA